MKRTHVILSIAFISLPFLLEGCKAKETPSSNSAPVSPAVTANANSSAASGSRTAATPPATEPPKLLGSYEAREVENKGVVTVISSIKTIFNFTEQGTYSRISQAKGKTYHSDGGLFQIEPPDKLTLTIQIADKNIKNPRIVKQLRFSLSPDGEELKLTSEKGTATYRKISKPKAS